MKSPHLLPALMLATLPLGVAGQVTTRIDDEVAAYHRAVADHFGVPTREVELFEEGGVGTAEIPLLLELARRAGIAPEALISLRRGGRGWGDLARRYGVGADAFHVPIDASLLTGELDALYAHLAETPRGSWDTVFPEGGVLVDLANLDFLSAYTRLPPATVLAAYQRQGSWLGAYQALLALR